MRIFRLVPFCIDLFTIRRTDRKKRVLKIALFGLDNVKTEKIDSNKTVSVHCNFLSYNLAKIIMTFFERNQQRFANFYDNLDIVDI